MAIFPCLFLLLFVIFSSPQPLSAQTASDWPMAGANPQRTGWNSEGVTGKLTPLWYKVFEPYILYRTQIIAVNDVLYVATARGLYSLDANTGNEKWVYPTELPLADTPTYANGVVYIGGFDKKMYAVNASNGTRKWAFSGAGAGFQVNPLVVDNTVYAGNRDGFFYAIDANNGLLKWKYKTDGPIVYSAAYTDGVVYFASQDSHAYALNSNGTLKWKSAKLPGGGFHSYWPVAIGNYVIFPGSLNQRKIGPFYNLGYQPERDDLWPNYATIPKGTLVGLPLPGESWSHGAQIMDLSKSNAGLSTPVSEYFEDDGQVRFDRHTNKPWRRTYFVLDKLTGKEKTYDFDKDGKPEYAPITFLGTWGVNTRYPPIVGPDNILYQYMTYMSSSGIAGGGPVGWKVDTPFASLPAGTVWNAMDEPHYLSGGGNMLYTERCCDRQSETYDVFSPVTRWKHFGYNLHEYIPEFQVKYFMPTAFPPYEGDLYRPTATFGRNGSYGRHGDGSPPIPHKGKLISMHGNSIVAFGKTTASAVKLPEAKIKTSVESVPIPTKEDLKTRLQAELKKIVAAGHLRPGYLASGFVDRELHECHDAFEDYWHHPADTIYFLLRTLPQITDGTLKQQVRVYIQKEFTDYSPYTVNHIGWNTGANRQLFSLPPEVESAMSNIGPKSEATGEHVKFGGWRFNPFTFYALYLYAQEFGNAKGILDTAKSKSVLMESFNNIPPDSHLIEFPHIHNVYIAAYAGYLNLEKLAGLPQSSSIKSKYDRLLSLRVSSFHTDHNWDQESRGNQCRAFLPSRNFIYIVPELTDYLRQNALTKVQNAVKEYDYLTPYWFVSKTETEFNEGVVRNIYDTHGLFQARAKVLNQSYTDLAKYIDVPAFEKGDFFYIDNLVSALEAGGTEPTSPPLSPAPTSNVLKQGDANGDGKVDGLDYVIWLNNYNKSVTTGAAAGDFNASGKVDGLDYVIWLNNYNK